MSGLLARWRSVAGACLFVASLLGGCNPPPTPALPSPDSVPVPDPRGIESVLFFMGDAGDAETARSPTLARLSEDIEWWSEALARDSSVALILLGDNRYTVGVRSPDDAGYAGDTTVIMSQVRTVAGPNAITRGARAYFVPGNHDWGLRKDWQGFGRLLNQREVLERAHLATGVNVSLVPEAGTGGPFIVDWGDHVRLLLVDTAWWMVLATPAEKQVLLGGIDEAVAGRGDRSVIIASHHPFTSAGPHAGQFSFWRTIGFRYLLHRSGAILEDLTSGPLRELQLGLRGIFERREPPLLYVGGHDHSLQVLPAREPSDPQYTLVSGSGSHLTEVGRNRPTMLFGQMAPGYMRVVIGRDGGITLFVEAVDPQYLACPGSEPERTSCMAAGAAAYHTVYWKKLK